MLYMQKVISDALHAESIDLALAIDQFQRGYKLEALSWDETMLSEGSRLIDVYQGNPRRSLEVIIPDIFMGVPCI